jgi:hypothetical protein
MIKNIIDLLQLSDWYGVSHNVDVAKGMYKAPSNWEQTKEILERVRQSKAYRNG